ncbi:putative chaperone protein HSP31 [Cystobasidium minutum MCA 4210]|uniref:putative chaperone protein HSP31 n=1 Tax=Cystobasidium minutum MCA 4210 TaxID=1397322 RepID=UPI0034CE31D8|eukprot:jgi/Rhomi1/45907/CE45906_16232
MSQPPTTHREKQEKTVRPKVLFVLSSCPSFKEGDKDHPTGWYLPECAHPFYELDDKVEIVFASPKGGEAPLDPSSVEASKDDPVSNKFLHEKRMEWVATEKLSQYALKVKEFAAVFFVGGHGPMFDMAEDETVHELVRVFAENDKVVAAVCHGPAAIVNVKLSNGNYLIANCQVTGFSNSEEDAVGLSKYMPFSLQDLLAKNSGNHYVRAEQDWGEKVVVEKGGKLITGQNPASAAGVGKAIAAAIGV